MFVTDNYKKSAVGSMSNYETLRKKKWWIEIYIADLVDKLGIKEKKKKKTIGAENVIVL